MSRMREASVRIPVFSLEKFFSGLVLCCVVLLCPSFFLSVLSTHVHLDCLTDLYTHTHVHCTDMYKHGKLWLHCWWNTFKNVPCAFFILRKPSPDVCSSTSEKNGIALCRLSRTTTDGWQSTADSKISLKRLPTLTAVWAVVRGYTQA